MGWFRVWQPIQLICIMHHFWVRLQAIILSKGMKIVLRFFTDLVNCENWVFSYYMRKDVWEGNIFHSALTLSASPAAD